MRVFLSVTVIHGLSNWSPIAGMLTSTGAPKLVVPAGAVAA